MENSKTNTWDTVIACISYLRCLQICVIVVSISELSYSYLPVPQPMNHAVYSCATKIVADFIDEDVLIVSINRELGNDGILSSEVQRYIFGNFQVMRVEMADRINRHIKKVLRYQQMHLVEFTGTADLEQTVNVSSSGQVWKSHVKFVVFSNSFFDNLDDTLPRIVEILSKTKIFNFVIVLRKRPDDFSNFNIFSWKPFSGGNCNHIFTNWYEAGKCESGEVTLANRAFENAIPHQLPNCTVRVGTVIAPPFVMRTSSGEMAGFEIGLVKLIARALKVKMVYRHSEKEWGRSYKNGTFTGELALVRDETIDVAVGSFTYGGHTLKYLDVGVPYYEEDIVWCVPRALANPEWQLIFLFGRLVPPAILVTFIAFTVLYWIGSTFPRGPALPASSGRIGDNVALAAFSAMLGEALPRTPRADSLRALLTIWLWFSFYLACFFQTGLTSVMTTKMRVVQMESIEEALGRGYRLKSLELFEDFFTAMLQEGSDADVLARTERCSDLVECLREVAYGRETALTLQRTYYEFVKLRYLNRHHEKLIHCFAENVATYPIQLAMRKKLFLRDRLDDAVRRIVAAGFTSLWDDQRQYMADFEERILEAEGKSIGTKHLVVAFVAFVVGSGAAVIAFVAELLHHKYVMRNRKKPEPYVFARKKTTAGE